MYLFDLHTGEELNLNSNSEFGTDGYDLAIISKAFEAAMFADNRPNVSVSDRVIECFNRRYSELSGMLEIVPSNSSTGPQEINANVFDSLEVKRLVNKLRSSYDRVRTYMDKSAALFGEKEADEYLNTFFDLSKEAVFSVSNYSLSSSLFRNSTFLKKLLSFAAEKKVWPAGVSDPSIAYYEYSFVDPFAYDTIQRALACIVKLERTLQRKKGRDARALNILRKELLLCSIQSAFRRFVTLDRKMYRLELNRHNSKLIAHPINELSSSEETKPIRLFEKTAAFIRNNIDFDLPEYELSVCIVGHTETSGNGCERSLSDYVLSVLSWYSHLPNKIDGKKKPKLVLKITDYINQFDEPSSNFAEERKPFKCEEDGHSAECWILKAPYEEFAFSTKRIKEIILDNQLIFLLDCPWLSTENYEIKQSSALDTYCYELKKRRRNDPKPELLLLENSSSFYRASAMHELDSQYNRIMSSRSEKAGEVVRVVLDDLVRQIQCTVNSLSSVNASEGAVKPTQKELYLFSSESDSIQYSYINSFPLTRIEQYDGKSFVILQFKTSPSKMLSSCETWEARFKFNLWGIIKYICVSYAYRFFKEEIEICLGKAPDNPILYFEIYRNILVCFDVEKDLRKINISVRFSDGLEPCLHRIDSEIDIEVVKYRLWVLTKDLIAPLYLKSVFGPSRQYGDDAIKKAFKMNLYSNAENVNTMLFCHRYRVVCERNSFDERPFTPKFDDHYNPEPEKLCENEFKDTDFFKDKKLYSELFKTFEQDSHITLGMRSMLHSAESIFGEPDIGKKLLENILKVCVSAGDRSSQLYLNTKLAYEQERWE